MRFKEQALLYVGAGIAFLGSVGCDAQARTDPPPPLSPPDTPVLPEFTVGKPLCTAPDQSPLPVGKQTELLLNPRGWVHWNRGGTLELTYSTGLTITFEQTGDTLNATLTSTGSNSPENSLPATIFIRANEHGPGVHVVEIAHPHFALKEPGQNKEVAYAIFDYLISIGVAHNPSSKDVDALLAEIDNYLSTTAYPNTLYQIGIEQPLVFLVDCPDGSLAAQLGPFDGVHFSISPIPSDPNGTNLQAHNSDNYNGLIGLGIYPLTKLPKVTTRIKPYKRKFRNNRRHPKRRKQK